MTDEVEVVEVVEPRKWFEAQTVISFSVIAAFLLLVFIWTFYQPKLDAGSRDIVMMLIGGLNTAVGSVIQFFLNRK